MDAAPWPQGFHQDIKLAKSMEEVTSNSNACNARGMLERKTRPQEQLNCPRCNSTNTKFCYYNNYSLNQPRYFCKTCRRYWTEGGSLRNVPVGGGSRKNKRSTTTTAAVAAAAASITKVPDLNPPTSSFFSSQNPKTTTSSTTSTTTTTTTHQGQDLNLAFPAVQESGQGISHYVEMPKTSDQNNKSSSSSSSTSYTSSPLSALELLRTGIASRGLSSFIPTPMPDSNTLYSSGFPLHEFKPTGLSFSVDHHGLDNRYNGVHQENGHGRIFFPPGEFKQLSTTSTEVDHHQNKGQGASSGYWNGMLGGGASW